MISSPEREELAPFSGSGVSPSPLWARLFGWAMVIGGLVALAALLRPGSPPPVDWAMVLWGAAFIAFLSGFPFLVGETEASLAHAVALTVAVAQGAEDGVLSLALGLVLGTIFQVLSAARDPAALPRPELLHRLWRGALSLMRQVLSLVAGMLLYLGLGGRPILESAALPELSPVLALGFGFAAAYLALHWLSLSLLESRRPDRREWLVLLLTTLLSIPFAAVAAASRSLLGLNAFIILGGLVCAVAPVVRELSVTEHNLQRRLKELSTLSRVGQAMRTSLDLETLLTTIYLQVTHLLQVESFYIALYTSADETLSYPLAVKDGVRQQWPSRPMADRLTDRVIRTASPILIPNRAPEILRQMGLPELNNAPLAWLGVPLLNPERAIGCMAVFHTRAGVPLTEKDQEILLTLADQAAVAIENALLYEQMRARADALSSLNEITSAMSASLDPDRTLDLVCRSMISIGGGQKSAIYLLAEGAERLQLARAVSLSEELKAAIGTIPLDGPGRARAFHEGAPVTAPHLSTPEVSRAYADDLQTEGIRAFIDLPLIAPSGTIGIASVYFTESQHFEADQIDLLRTLATHAALAVANARVHAETDHELRRRVEQLSALEAVGRKMAATLDPDELFSTILDHALSITASSTGHLAVFDPERQGLQVVAQRGYPEGSPAADAGVHAPDQGIPALSFQSGRVHNVADTRLDPNHIDWTGGQTRSVLSVPILRWGQHIGVVTVESPRPSAFALDEENIVQQLAAHAGVALSNANLYQQLEARLREQSLLYQASVQLAAKLQAEVVARAATDSLALALGVEGARIYRWLPYKRTLQLEAGVDEGRPLMGAGHAGITMAEAPALATCLKSGAPNQWTPDDAPTAADREYLVESRHSASILALPLRVGDQTLGLAEALSRRKRRFDENEIRMAQTIASQAAIALQNADLFLRVRRNQERLMAVLNSTHEGMLMVDTTGRVVVTNHQLENMTGLSLEGIVGGELTDPALNLSSCLGYRPGELANLMAALRSGEASGGEIVTFDLQDPFPRVLQRSEAPVRDTEGQLIGWLIVLRDVSEERKLNEAREQLTQMIVHDLRSPLTTILSSLKLLEGNLPQERPPILAQAISVSNRSCEQMLGLVNSLLDIAKLESGEFQLHLRPVSLGAICVDLMAAFVPEANELGVILNQSVEADLPEILADEEKLRRVIANLLDNALKFTPSGGQVDVEVIGNGTGVLLSVIDTGPGIPEAMHHQIFERFVQADSQQGRRRGTGLGLSFSKLAVEAHGGRIWVEENPRGGSAFRVRLPKEPPAAPETKAEHG